MGAGFVMLAYRRQKERMGAYEFEYDLAKSVGVKGLFNITPLEILGQDKVAGIRLAETHEVDGLLVKKEGSEFDIPCDQVIRATGQSKQIDFLEQINGLELDSKGRIKVNNQFQTTNPKYFAAGDAVNGGVEVVNACAEAKQAAKGIHAFLQV